MSQPRGFNFTEAVRQATIRAGEPSLPFTSPAKKALELGMETPRVGEVFAKHQIDLERLRAAVNELEQEQR